MKTDRCLLLVTLILCFLAFPAVASDAPLSSASISSAAADTSGTPPQEAALYINETRVAVAGQNWTGALRITTRGIAWYPENAELLCLQGYTYRKMGQYQMSVNVVSRAILLDPKTVRYANRGYGYLALGNYSAALADAESGLSLDAGYTTNSVVKALALRGMGKNTEALAASEEAISQSPGSAHYWHVKGRILASAGNCTGAREALERSLALDAGYVLPYPGFGSASGDLAGLNVTCAKAATPQATPKSPLSAIAVAGIIGAAIAFGLRK
jgi:tetratricopeptide (TPR) repeat protein